MYILTALCLAFATAMVSGRPQYQVYPSAYGHYGAPAYGHYGAPAAPVHDTPEVAHAKAAHFAAVAAAGAGGHHGGYYGGGKDHSGAYIHDPTGDHAPAYVHDPSGDYAPAYNHYTGGHGGYAGAYGGHGGYAGAYGGHGGYAGTYGGHGGYAGVAAVPYAASHALSVPVHDTPEVAAAKAAHFVAHAAAKGHHYG